MFKKTVVKDAILAALMTLSITALEASASENEGEPGLCNDNFAFDTLVPVAVTPALLEELRAKSGAAIVRHEKPGFAYTQDFRVDRLRVISDANNRFSRYKCG